MRNSYKIVKYAITVLLVAWLIISYIFSARLGEYLMSFSPQVQEDEAVIDYFSRDSGTNFVLEPGGTLTLPIHLEKRLSRIGIYVGEQANSVDEYTFQLEDGFGSVLGKTSMCLADMTENQFVYVTSRSVISNADTYYVKIFSDSSSHTPLNLNVSLAASFQTTAFVVDGETSEFTLVVDKRYEIDNVKIVIYVDIILSAVVVLIWIIPVFKGPKIKQVRLLIGDKVKALPWKKVNVAFIILLIAANIVLAFAQKTVYFAQGGNSRSREFGESTIPLHEDTVLEQYLYCEGKEGQADSFSLLFATYTQKIEGGTVSIELWDDTTHTQIYNGVIETEKILDNQYQYFTLSDPVQLGGHTFRFRLQADYPSEDDCIAVYTSSNHSSNMYVEKNGDTLNQSLIFDFSKQAQLYQTNIALLIDAVLIAALLLYIWKFTRFHKKIYRYFLSSVLISVFTLVPILSFLNYGEISVNGMESCIQRQIDWSAYQQFSEDELADRMYRETEYDFVGTPLIAYERIELPIDGGISDIKLQFRGSNMVRKDYDIQIYWNTGNGYHDAKSYTYKYIHQGDNELSFQIPCSEPVRSIMLNVGMSGDRFTGTKLPERIFPLTNLECNVQTQNNQRVFPQIATTFVAILCFSMFAHLWKYLNWDEKLANLFVQKKISIPLSFSVLAAILGISMSFLIPTFQVPDEPAHISMLFADMGQSSTEAALLDTLGDQGAQGVMLNSGQTVDTRSYLEASTRRLEDDSFPDTHFSLRVMRRPGQALGVCIGELLRLPVYWILQLGELGALVVYVAVGALTLKIIPYKKNLMMLIMLLPVAMQEAGSFAYDSFNNALAFFTIAYILHLKVRVEKISWKQLFVLALLSAGLLIGKVIYVLLMGLVLSIPLRKLELKLGGAQAFTINEMWVRKHRVGVLLTLLIGLVLCAAGGFAVIRMLGYGEVDNLLWGYISSFPQLVRLCVVTVIVHGRLWLRGMVSALGNYDVPVNTVITWIGIGSAIIFAVMHHRRSDVQIFTAQQRQDSCFSGWDLLVWYGLFAILFVVVEMTMISWGFFIYGIDEGLPYSTSMRLLPRIEGVQGRYFYPILPLLLIPLHLKKDFLSFIPAGLYKVCYYMLMTVYPISLLLIRYWGIGHW